MKYWSLFVRGLVKALQYRSEILIWFILDMLPILVLLFVWTSIYSQQNTISGYNLAQVLQYYLFALIINALTASHFEQWRVLEIRNGKIDFFLTRPLSYLAELGIPHFAGKVFYCLIALPIFFGLWSLISIWLDLGSVDISVVAGIQFLGLMAYTFMVELLIASIIVLLGFWIEGSEGLEHFKWIVITLLSGWMIPVVMMPNWLQNIVLKLPFRYMYDVPISILQNKTVLQPLDIVYTTSFVFGLMALTWFVWQKAKYQYASAGG